MPFKEEPTSYSRGIFSDLQSSWGCLRDEVLKLPDAAIMRRLVFHIDEATSWESVRDLEKMQQAVLLIGTIVQQEKLTGQVPFWLDDVRATLSEIKAALKQDERP